MTQMAGMVIPPLPFLELGSIDTILLNFIVFSCLYCDVNSCMVWYCTVVGRMRDGSRHDKHDAESRHCRQQEDIRFRFRAVAADTRIMTVSSFISK